MFVFLHPAFICSAISDLFFAYFYLFEKASDLFDTGTISGKTAVLVCLRCSLAELYIRGYETNGGSELFLSFETSDRKTLFGFLRLRLRGDRNSRDCPFTSLKGAALLRELHVYGEQVVFFLAVAAL